MLFLNRTDPFSRLSDTEVCPRTSVAQRTTRQTNIQHYSYIKQYKPVSFSSFAMCVWLQQLTTTPNITLPRGIALLTSQLTTTHFAICLRLGVTNKLLTKMWLHFLTLLLFDDLLDNIIDSNWPIKISNMWTSVNAYTKDLQQQQTVLLLKVMLYEFHFWTILHQGFTTCASPRNLGLCH